MLYMIKICPIWYEDTNYLDPEYFGSGWRKGLFEEILVSEEFTHRIICRL